MDRDLPVVMLVDDDPGVLNALRRRLHGRYQTIMASNGGEAVMVIQEEGPVAVVVCDMNMPGMSGVDTLAEIAALSPDTARIMLTGQTDIDTAMRAVNEGSIFRFYAKPCDTENLIAGVKAGARQHRLASAERELLDKTLSGSIKMLTDILAMQDPDGYAHSREMKPLARAAARIAGAPEDAWTYELAFMLAPIGRSVLPPEIVDKLKSGATLEPIERDVYHASADVAHRLIRNIPRLEEVAEHVRRQFKNFDGSGHPVEDIAGDAIPAGARALRILNALRRRLAAGENATGALRSMRAEQGVFDRRLLAALEPEIVELCAASEESVSTASLRSGDRLLTPIVDNDSGETLLRAGSVLSAVHIDKLENLRRFRNLSKRVRIQRRSNAVDAAA